MKPIGVIGLGNPLRRDDGIGIIILQKIKEKKESLPLNLDYIDGGTGGMNLINIFSKYKIIILIDAMNIDSYPGDYRFIRLDQLSIKKNKNKEDIHNPDILKLIKFSKEISKNPEKVYIFGIQTKDTSFLLQPYASSDSPIILQINVVCYAHVDARPSLMPNMLEKILLFV